MLLDSEWTVCPHPCGECIHYAPDDRDMDEPPPDEEAGHCAKLNRSTWAHMRPVHRTDQPACFEPALRLDA